MDSAAAAVPYPAELTCPVRCDIGLLMLFLLMDPVSVSILRISYLPTWAKLFGYFQQAMSPFIGGDISFKRGDNASANSCSPDRIIGNSSFKSCGHCSYGHPQPACAGC